MSQRNQTSITEIFLLGFEGPVNVRVIMFILLFVIYMGTLGGNSVIVVLVSLSQRLHSPMYFFLCHLSVTDIMISSSVVPNMLYFSLQGRGVISFSNCLTQLFFFGMAIGVECLLLTVMSYDRYLAICRPLHYLSIMDLKLQTLLVTFSWLIGFSAPFLIACSIPTLSFCGPNIINRFFCDTGCFLELSCSNTFLIDTELLLTGYPMTALAFVFIIVTYVYIFRMIFGSSITTGKQKAFSTCSSHLTVVCAYYGSLIINYMIPIKGDTIIINKYLSLLYTLMTPLFNPIIYTLRNKEIRFTLNYYIQRSIA
ncbi:hypothetical protein XELAEV_18019356mg [Xenopus laevis]|uniref:Olfactory receptor n=1 Tax=Xenopus laevis TaxID=8355 RepID=A0A974HUG0_XENLA|nr:hypothetical protein XELAEV_18019356mg [Xenopus laevis]